MKKVCSFLRNLIILVYILLIIFVTVCLLSYNDYKVTVFGRNTIIPVIDDDLEPNYTIGDLLIVEQNKFSSIKEGDEILFYRVVAGEVSISYANVINIERIGENEYEYTVEGGDGVPSSNFIGKTDTVTIVPKVGSFFSILQSKWGFLFLVVFPSLIAFLYTLYSVVLELKDNSVVEEEQKEEDKKIEKEEKLPEEPEEKEIASIEENQETEKVEDLEESKEPETFEEPEENIVQPEEDSEKPEEGKIEEQSEQQKRKALIAAKITSMTDEEKRALIEAKLKSMTEEEKRAFIEAKRRK